MKIFIVEDDPIITEGLKIALGQEGYEVETHATCGDALEKLKGGVDFDVCLLDVMLPDGDGYRICKALREISDVPVLFLTACDDEVHTVLALEQGADDYIAKPFRIRELVARIKAVMRRSGKSVTNAQEEKDAQELIRIGENELNLSTGRILRGGEEIFLSAAEYRLLLVFVRNRGKLLTRSHILNEMWDSAGDFVNDNTLTVYVRRIRKKLEAEGDAPVIETVRGVGYRMD
ncbi:MAG: response regulator transcription factor [Lachnospiraceae bacterium]|nr:response regulator transcription factor [Lachnospiraceae bacterium]